MELVLLAYLNIRQSKALAIKIGSSNARLPTQFDVATEDYALSRRLYMYLPETSENKYARQFLKMVSSPLDQEIVQQIGFISQNIKALDYQVSEVYPDEYISLVKKCQTIVTRFQISK